MENDKNNNKTMTNQKEIRNGDMRNENEVTIREKSHGKTVNPA